MAYSEEISRDGLITRKYFRLDKSGIFKMYYNGQIVKFPIKELPMGEENSVVISIDTRKFLKNFILKKAYIKIRCSNNYLRHKLRVYQVKNITSKVGKEIGYMEKSNGGYFVFDVTQILLNHLNTRLNLYIKTKSRVDLYSLFAFYDKNAEFIIQYYDDSYIGNSQLYLKHNNHNIQINQENGICIITRPLISVGMLDLKLIINSHQKDKLFRFNYGEYVYGGVNNYKYIDSLGIKHYFKLKENNFKTHYDLFNKDITLETAAKYTLKKRDEEHIFNNQGYITQIKNIDGDIHFIYDLNNNISTIIDSNNNQIHFTYSKNDILISNSKNSKKIIIVLKDNYLIINNKKYLFNEKGNLINFSNLSFKYDQINRIKQMNILNKKINFKYKKKEGM